MSRLISIHLDRFLYNFNRKSDQISQVTLRWQYRMQRTIRYLSQLLLDQSIKRGLYLRVHALEIRGVEERGWLARNPS